jgi:hypothetical protein
MCDGMGTAESNAGQWLCKHGQSKPWAVTIPSEHCLYHDKRHFTMPLHYMTLIDLFLSS